MSRIVRYIDYSSPQVAQAMMDKRLHAQQRAEELTGTILAWLMGLSTAGIIGLFWYWAYCAGC